MPLVWTALQTRQKAVFVPRVSTVEEKKGKPVRFSPADVFICPSLTKPLGFLTALCDKSKANRAIAFRLCWLVVVDGFFFVIEGVCISISQW